MLDILLITCLLAIALGGKAVMPARGPSENVAKV